MLTEARGSARVRRAQRQADAFNERFPVGTPVRCWTGLREGPGKVSRTRARAAVVSDHASVWIEGVVGSVALSHVDVIGARERPILFSGPLVRQLLAGAKTQTRRIIGGMEDVRHVGPCERDAGYTHPGRVCSPGPGFHYHAANGFNHGEIECPYGVPGDRLWVRETWGAWRQTSVEYDEWEPVTHPLGGSWAREVEELGQPHIEYRATSESVGPWKPSIHMPRWASRILLEITEVRVERLQAITEEDARAEGVEPCGGFMATSGRWTNYASDGPSLGTARDSFRTLWDEINGPRAPWSSNPWVWALTFRRVQP